MAEKASAFAPDNHVMPSLIFPDKGRIRPFQQATFMCLDVERFRKAFPYYVRQGYIVNTIAYFALASMAAKKFYNIDLLV